MSLKHMMCWKMDETHDGCLMCLLFFAFFCPLAQLLCDACFSAAVSHTDETK